MAFLGSGGGGQDGTGRAGSIRGAGAAHQHHPSKGKRTRHSSTHAAYGRRPSRRERSGLGRERLRQRRRLSPSAGRQPHGPSL
eukprot:13594609-Heterocapsa_arctica.AAC.1